jgi:hypothetical protein
MNFESHIREYVRMTLLESDVPFAGKTKLRVFDFDDSQKNVEAVRDLQRSFPSVKIIARHVVHRLDV